jgi:hypothetical protein
MLRTEKSIETRVSITAFWQNFWDLLDRPCQTRRMRLSRSVIHLAQQQEHVEFSIEVANVPLVARDKTNDQDPLGLAFSKR